MLAERHFGATFAGSSALDGVHSKSMSDTSSNPTEPSPSEPIQADASAVPATPETINLPVGEQVLITGGDTPVPEPSAVAEVPAAAGPESAVQLDEKIPETATSLDQVIEQHFTEKHIFELSDVKVGDSNGFATIVVRMLGMGDSGIFDENASNAIKQLQQAAGLEATGVVSGETWGLILPMVGRNASGELAAILRGLLGLSPTGMIDHEVYRILVHNLGNDWNGLVTSAEWRKLLTTTITLPDPEVNETIDPTLVQAESPAQVPQPEGVPA